MFPFMPSQSMVHGYLHTLGTPSFQTYSMKTRQDSCESVRACVCVALHVQKVHEVIDSAHIGLEGGLGGLFVGRCRCHAQADSVYSDRTGNPVLWECQGRFSPSCV